MKTTLKIILGITIFLTISGAFCSAYQLEEKYKPANAPSFLKAEDKNKPADQITVIVLQTIAGAMLYFAAPVAVILIVMAAFTITSAAGETEKIDQGKKHLTWAIIGLLIVILSYSIARYAISMIIKAGENVSETTLLIAEKDYRLS